MISGSRSLAPLAEGENAGGMLTDARDRMRADVGPKGIRPGLPTSSDCGRSLHDRQLDGGVGGARRSNQDLPVMFCARPSKKWAAVPYPTRVT